MNVFFILGGPYWQKYILNCTPKNKYLYTDNSFGKEKLFQLCFKMKSKKK
jgi:hypothetical protein